MIVRNRCCYPDLPGDRLILGKTEAATPTGFAGATKRRAGKWITYDGLMHLMTVAPTRSGKGRDVIVPNLLNYCGSTVVFDPKGELYSITHRRRRSLGHRIHVLDPFKTVVEQTDSLNPFDLMRLPGTHVEIDGRVIAEMFARGFSSSKEPFWDTSGTSLNAGYTMQFAAHKDPSKRNIPAMMDLLFGDDTVYNSAVLLDTLGKTMPKAAYREIATVLQMPEITRGGVIATSQSYLRTLNTEAVLDSMRDSTIDLVDFADGVPMTIYLVIPPNRLTAFRSLFRLWMGTLTAAVLTRKRAPALRTLFLLDEMAQLEHFPLLESMLTLCTGYGAIVWGFLQDLAQLQTHYPTSWKTILNNCGVIQAFGFGNRSMAQQWSEHLDHSPRALRALGPKDQVLSIKDRGEVLARRINYLTNKRFTGLYDGNPFFAIDPPDAQPGR